jgi:hypothetical protein
MLQKIEHVCGSISLNDQGHSPCPSGEDLLWQLYACDELQYRIQFLEARSSHWQPSSASPEEREEETYTPKSYKVKLEWLYSARLARRGQAVKLLDMQRLQVVKDT